MLKQLFMLYGLNAVDPYRVHIGRIGAVNQNGKRIVDRKHVDRLRFHQDKIRFFFPGVNEPI